jgi:hypothetical protein
MGWFFLYKTTDLISLQAEIDKLLCDTVATSKLSRAFALWTEYIFLAG